jgi:hypothetical protein
MNYPVFFQCCYISKLVLLWAVSSEFIIIIIIILLLYQFILILLPLLIFSFIESYETKIFWEIRRFGNVINLTNFT